MTANTSYPTQYPAAAAKIAELPAQAPAARLLAWYGSHARVLPWRVGPWRKHSGETAGSGVGDPYAIWLSEIMLQQTTVVTVAPYFRAFLDRWPRVEDLAAAPLDAVLSAWAGLGYYARARNLHACARAVCADHGGRFPDTEAGLQALPGIGPYTAAAVAAIAFGRRAVAVDGNVERVTARLFAVAAPLPGAKAVLRRHAESLLPPDNPDPGDSEVGFPYGDLAQALMDLGATVCLPAKPRCDACPLAGDCRGRAAGLAAELPHRAPRRARPLRRGIAFWLTRADGAVLLRRRAESGLLGGMMEVPSTEWREAPWSAEDARAQAPIAAPPAPHGAVHGTVQGAPAPWQPLPGVVRHGFTHFRLELEVWTAPALGDSAADSAAGLAGALAAGAGQWTRPEDLDSAALPTLMRKVVRHALEAGDSAVRGKSTGNGA